MTDLDSEPRPSRRLWILAGLAALVLHIGGGALALAHLQNGEPEEPLGAPAIEIGLELSAPRAEVTDLPPGPEQDTSVASPAIAEQKAEVEPTELPKDQPTQTETADRQVAPNEANKPKEDDAKPAVVATAASQESIAAEASATPSSEDSPIGRSQAPVEGVGKALQRVKASWIA